MILVEKGNVQLRIEESKLKEYLAQGFVKYEPLKEEPKKVEEPKTIKKPLKEEE